MIERIYETREAALAAAVAADIEPTDPGVLDAHPGYVLLNTTTGETTSLDPEDYRMFDGQPADELRSAMEIAVESEWLYADERGEQAVLVPERLITIRVPKPSEKEENTWHQAPAQSPPTSNAPSE